MTCNQSIFLIASAIEGRVAPIELDTLVSHLERCPACRTEAEAQTMVKRILASRPGEPLPGGFALRLAARLDAERPHGVPLGIDWRTWTVRLLPAAAGLVLVAVVTHQVIRYSSPLDQPADRSADLATAVASRGRSAVRALQTPVDLDLSGPALLWASLMEPTAKPESTGNDAKKEVP